ncbi:proteasome beta subunit [Methylacidimicrobium cyclopophantes]|uniref:Proteasome beta subunit n=1 Tax=Methylacidimicrobium cyclopophantes TaxID=1041766 RepID=A0A5E6M8T2_9BACT|nr:proteasome subunit alpha [Methylacidimicrobium cyclopophantes]VVM05347.1 proteasome beta subunit [Methylacidimicrobium cyclopophantes]
MEILGVSAGAQTGDFVAVLRSRNLLFPEGRLAQTGSASLSIPESTTVLSFHYRDGVIVAGDRRATMGHTVIHDRADKVIEIDRFTVMAIAGTPATAYEIARVLQHSFEYYRRSQLQPLSTDAKVRMVGKLLKENLALTLQGVGVVVPVLALVDPQGKGSPKIFFYDALGAQFEAVDFAVSGSGSPAARSVLQYLNRWSESPPARRTEEEAIILALQLLDVAAESDTATGGIDRRTRIYPQVKLVRKSGVKSIPEERLSLLLPASV